MGCTVSHWENEPVEVVKLEEPVWDRSLSQGEVSFGHIIDDICRKRGSRIDNFKLELEDEERRKSMEFGHFREREARLENLKFELDYEEQRKSMEFEHLGGGITRSPTEGGSREGGEGGEGCSMCEDWPEDCWGEDRIHMDSEVFNSTVELGEDRLVERRELKEEEGRNYGLGEEEGGEEAVECWVCGEAVNAGDDYRKHLSQAHTEDELLDDLESSFDP